MRIEADLNEIIVMQDRKYQPIPNGVRIVYTFFEADGGVITCILERTKKGAKCVPHAMGFQYVANYEEISQAANKQ